MPTPDVNNLVQQFLDGLSRGELAEEIFTQDMSFWSISSGDATKQRFLEGIRLLSRIAGGSIRYKLVSLTAEDERVVAEVTSSGVLTNGEPLANSHVFLFRLSNGKIASCAEYMDQMVVREKILPLMQAAAAKQ